jgi:two-component system sensor histidine kinase/response regulator
MTEPTATILVVDDEIQNRKVLEAFLKPEGYLIRMAANGEEALASVSQRAPDLILLDAMMPGMDGFQVASQLKAHSETASIPVIMVTARMDKASRLAGLNAGAEEFLTKPVDRAELWLRVRNLLRLKAYGDLLRDQGLVLEQQVQARTAALEAAQEHLLRKVEELHRSNEELAQFAYVASHDLQEPLRMVASYTQLLSTRYSGKLDATADEFIKYAVDGAIRMEQLIRDLLNLSRVGTKGLAMLSISSEGALLEALRNLRGAIEDSSALVTHDPLPNVMGDQIQLVQLFQNLVGNAIKYQNPGVPRIHVSAVKNGGDQWTFSIQDNGLGIEPQYFERIFGMFQRLHGRDKFSGTGIGLAICKKIVERHGGRISVDSKPGMGSTFRFTLADALVSTGAPGWPD